MATFIHATTIASSPSWRRSPARCSIKPWVVYCTATCRMVWGYWHSRRPMIGGVEGEWATEYGTPWSLTLFFVKSIGSLLPPLAGAPSWRAARGIRGLDSVEKRGCHCHRSLVSKEEEKIRAKKVVLVIWTARDFHHYKFHTALVRDNVTATTRFTCTVGQRRGAQEAPTSSAARQCAQPRHRKEASRADEWKFSGKFKTPTPPDVTIMVSRTSFS